MRRWLTITLLVLFAAPAAAGDSEPSAPHYAFVPVAAGALRLDTETGEVSLCVAGEAAPACTRVSENVRLTVAERTRLEARIADLEKRMAALEAGRHEDARADEAAIRRVRTLVGRAMDQLFGSVRGVKDELRGSAL